MEVMALEGPTIKVVPVSAMAFTFPVITLLPTSMPVNLKSQYDCVVIGM
jgi:hypothetical protein